MLIIKKKRKNHWFGSAFPDTWISCLLTCNPYQTCEAFRNVWAEQLCVFFQWEPVTAKCAMKDWGLLCTRQFLPSRLLNSWRMETCWLFPTSSFFPNRDRDIHIFFWISKIERFHLSHANIEGLFSTGSFCRGFTSMLRVIFLLHRINTKYHLAERHLNIYLRIFD